MAGNVTRGLAQPIIVDGLVIQDFASVLIGKFENGDNLFQKCLVCVGSVFRFSLGESATW